MWTLGQNLESLKNAFKNSGLSVENYSNIIMAFRESVRENGGPSDVDFTGQDDMEYNQGAANALAELSDASAGGSGWVNDDGTGAGGGHRAYDHLQRNMQAVACPGDAYTEAFVPTFPLTYRPDEDFSIEFALLFAYESGNTIISFESSDATSRIAVVATGIGATYRLETAFGNGGVEVSEDFALENFDISVTHHFVLSHNASSSASTTTTFWHNGVEVARVTQTPVSNAAMTLLALGGALGDVNSSGYMQFVQVYDWAYHFDDGDVLILFNNASPCIAAESDLQTGMFGPFEFTVSTDVARTTTDILPLTDVGDDALIYFDVEDAVSGESIIPVTPFVDSTRDDYYRLDRFKTVVGSLDFEAGRSYHFIIFSSDATAGLRFDGWNLYTGNEANIEILAFNNFPLSSGGSQFKGFEGTLSHANTDVPTILGGTSLESCFEDTTFELFPGIQAWNVSEVVSLRNTFRNNANFNNALNLWGENTSNVTTLEGTFEGCSSFNQFLGAWNTENVTSCRATFSGCGSLVLSTRDLDWNVQKVTDATNMFRDCTNFAPTSIFQFAEGAVLTQTVAMFDGCAAFNATGLENWDVRQVGDARTMFRGCTEFNRDISSWDVAGVTNLSNMFNGATAFNQDLSTWTIQDNANANSFFSESGMSVNNYSLTLEGWAMNSTPPLGVSFLNQNAMTYDAEALPYRYQLIHDHGWTIAADALVRTTLPELYGPFSLSFDVSASGGTMNLDIIAGIADGDLYLAGLTELNETGAGAMYEQYGDLHGHTDGANTFLRYDSAQSMTGVLAVAGASTVTLDVWTTDITSGGGIQIRNPTTGANVTRFPSFVQQPTIDISGFNTFPLHKDGYQLQNYVGTYSIVEDGPVPTIHTGTTFFYGFINSTSLPPNLHLFDMSEVTSLASSFVNTRLTIPYPAIEAWDVGQVTSLNTAFRNTSFNRDISNWDVGGVTTAAFMFLNASSFDQDLGAWALNASGLATMAGMFSGSGMSLENYSNTLIGFYTTVEGAGNPRDVIFTGQTGMRYNSAANPARELLIADHGWQIDGDSFEPSSVEGFYGPLEFTITPTASRTMTNLPLEPGSNDESSVIFFDVEDTATGTSILPITSFVDESDDDYARLDNFTSQGTAINLAVGTTYNFTIYSGDATTGLRFDGWNVYAGNEATIDFIAFNSFPLGKNGFQFRGFAGTLSHASTDVPTILEDTSLQSCFQGATFTAFPGIYDWDLTNVTSMESFLEDASNFNQSIDS